MTDTRYGKRFAALQKQENQQSHSNLSIRLTGRLQASDYEGHEQTGFASDQTMAHPQFGIPQYGIALRKTRSLRGRICYEVVETGLANGDKSLAVRADDSEIIALWRGLARERNLPLLIEHDDGHREPVQPMLGSITLGPYRPQRRGMFTRMF